MAPRSWLLGITITLWLCGGVHAADDVILLGGKADDAKMLTLKGSAATTASTVEVFHGRLLACLCHRAWGYGAPMVAYSSGCLGGCYGYGCYGYGCQGYTGPAYGPVYPFPGSVPTAYGAAIAPGYSSAAPAMGVYGPPRPVVPRLATSVTVTTPRFSVSVGNGVIIGRTALASGRLTGLSDQPIDAPPSEPMPDPRFRGETLPTPRARPGQTFRYDGGPASPVPMPGAVPAPTQDAPRPGGPANRVKLPPKQRPAYPAYGDERTPPSGSPNVLVKNPAR